MIKNSYLIDFSRFYTTRPYVFNRKELYTGTITNSESIISSKKSTIFYINNEWAYDIINGKTYLLCLNKNVIKVNNLTNINDILHLYGYKEELNCSDVKEIYKTFVKTKIR